LKERVYALSGPDGRDYEDLGINFREIAANREDLARVFEQLKQKASDIIERDVCL
jgi:hypothetical protein